MLRFASNLNGNHLSNLQPNCVISKSWNKPEVPDSSVAFLDEPFEFDKFYTFEAPLDIFIGVADFDVRNGLPMNMYSKFSLGEFMEWFTTTGVFLKTEVEKVGTNLGKDEIRNVLLQTYYTTVRRNQNSTDLTSTECGPVFSIKNTNDFHGFIGFGIHKIYRPLTAPEYKCTISVDEKFHTFNLPLSRDFFSESSVLFVNVYFKTFKGIKIMNVSYPGLSKPALSKLFKKGL